MSKAKTISMILSLAIIVAMFQKWLNIPLLDGLGSIMSMGNQSTSYSLFNIKDFIDIFKGYDESNTLSLISAALNISTFLVIGINALYILLVIKNAQSAKKVGKYAEAISIIFSIAFIIIVFYFNSGIKDSSYGMIAFDSVKATIMPYAIIILALIQGIGFNSNITE